MRKKITTLSDVYGKTPNMLVIDYLLKHNASNISQISKKLKYTRKTIYKSINDLKRRKIITKLGRVKPNAIIYGLDLESQRVRAIKNFIKWVNK